jgi:predicted PurR-regulated permease PerM
MPSATGTAERRSIRLTGTAALIIVGTIVGLVVLRSVFIAAHRPISWAVAAAAVAVLVDPIVDRLAVHIRRVPAVLVTFLAIGVIGVGITYLVFDEVEQAINRLEVEAPKAAEAIEARDDRVGELARDFELTRRVEDAVSALETRVTGGSDVLRSTAGTAPAYLVCTVLTIFLLTFGPRMASAALAQDSDIERRARIAQVVGPAVAHARSAIVFAVTEALAVGLVVAAIATWLDLPAPSAVGFTAGVLSLLPHVGLTIGALPLLLLSLAFSSLTTTIVLLVLVLATQIADSFLIRPRMAALSVEVGLVVPWVVALLGYTVYGIGGAAYGAMYAVFGLAILDQLERLNEERAATPAAPATTAET